MLKKLKLELFKVIEDSGLNAQDFILENAISDNGMITVVGYKYSGIMRFRILHNKEHNKKFSYAATHFHGVGVYRQNRLLHPDNQDKWESFLSIKKKLLLWLKNDVAEFIAETKDDAVWAGFKDNTPFGINIVPFENRNPFTNEEQRKIIGLMDDLKNEIISKLHLSNEHQKIVIEQLDYISQAVKRLNKFDWSGIALAIFISIITNLTVSHEQGQELYALFKEFFQSIPPLLLGI